MSKIKIIAIAIIIGIILITAYIYYTAEFNMISSTGIKREAFDPKETYYFGHELKWNGLASPTIQKINVVRNNGKVIGEDDQEVLITPLIDYSRHTGVLIEKTYQEMLTQNIVNYETVNRNNIKNDEFTLVLRVKTGNESLEYDIKGIVFYYKVLGLPKKQFFDYNGFLKD